MTSLELRLAPWLRFASAFAVECEDCGGELRPPEQFGVKIRKA